MNEKALKLSEGLVDRRYVAAGAEALRTADHSVTSLLAQRRLPDTGMPPLLVERLLLDLAAMDSNNFPHHVGAGEREGRVVSATVQRRHLGMAHGVGRSGDLLADQPKAAGSSILAKLANVLAADALRQAGCPSVDRAIVVPMATGMSLALVLQAVKACRGRPATARVVIWPRIDQKTCLKCIPAAGFEPHPVPLRAAAVQDACEDLRGAVEADGSELSVYGSHPEDVAAAIDAVGADNVVCVLCTTSCFAPRLPDDPLALARVCQPRSVPLVVNNAYGVQSPLAMKRLDAALRLPDARDAVAAFVQSGDKNFLVPVGGSVVAGPKAVVAAVASLYAGRAALTPASDIAITLLELGRAGWGRLLNDRMLLLPAFRARVAAFAAARNERLLADTRNDISFAVTLRNFATNAKAEAKADTAAALETALGGVLFRQGVTGVRIVVPRPESAATTLCGHRFGSYGAHCDTPTAPLLVMACGLGMAPAEVDGFLARLEAAYPVPE